MKKRIAALLSLVLVMSFAFGGTVSADYDPAPKSISRLNYSSRTVKVGKEFEMKAYTSPYDSDDDKLVWSIGNTKIVKFADADHRGDDMEFIARKKGTTKITCKIEGTSIKKSCTIHVKSAGKAKITVDDTYMDIDKGEWEDIEAKLIGGSYKNRKLTYKVHNKKIVKVSGGRVYGKRIGNTKITIYAKADKKVKKVVYVRVERDD